MLLAALSIPLADPKPADEIYFEYDLQKEKNLRMGSLLGFTITPKREYLLQDLVPFIYLHALSYLPTHIRFLKRLLKWYSPSYKIFMLPLKKDSTPSNCAKRWPKNSSSSEIILTLLNTRSNYKSSHSCGSSNKYISNFFI